VSHSNRSLLMLIAILTFHSDVSAQAPVVLEPAAPAPAVEEPAYLKDLPRPPDAPRSLLLPAPPQASTDAAAEAPYFQVDPLLDPSELGRPGWFMAAEASLLKPHLVGQLSPDAPLTVPGVGAVAPQQLTSVPLDWTGAPKITAGYRLPSGFGAFCLSYRFFNSDGSGPVGVGTTGLSGAAPAAGISRLSLNQLDIDYVSREYTPNPQWGMQWWLGMRLSDIFFNMTARDPAPGGIDAVSASDLTLGIGAHGGVELDRRIGNTGLLLVNKVDMATLGAKANQNFAAASSTLGTAATSQFSHSTTIGYVNWQIGVGWQPPSLPRAHFFTGYQLENWWNVGTVEAGNSRMYLGAQGVVWQAAFNF
jgi:hypothetical protein